MSRDYTNRRQTRTNQIFNLFLSTFTPNHLFLIMSGHDNEELVAYEDEEDLVTTTNTGNATQNGTVEKDKKYAGIHSTGFR